MFPLGESACRPVIICCSVGWGGKEVWDEVAGHAGSEAGQVFNGFGLGSGDAMTFQLNILASMLTGATRL